MTTPHDNKAMNLKRYKTEYDGKYEMVVEVDHAVMTDDSLREINDFWSGAEERLVDAGGDVLKVVLKMLMVHAMCLTIETWDAVRAFDWKTGNGQEGWPSMDGSKGIKIVSIDQVQFDEDDIEVREIAA